MKVQSQKNTKLQLMPNTQLSVAPSVILVEFRFGDNKLLRIVAGDCQNLGL
jgi:hypothetical protein